MTELCRTCRYWTRRRADEQPGLFAVDEDETHRAAYELWGRCALAKGRDGKPVVATTKAWADDYDDYKADLLTLDDFGCVQWESKS